MTAAEAWGRLRARGGATRLLVWGGLLLALVAAAAWPYAYLFEYIAGPVALGVAVAGYLPRRRWSDALWLALPAVAASWIEPGTATRVLAFLVLPCFVLTLRPRFALALAGSLMALLLAGLHLKLEFAGTRLTWQDLRFFFLQFHDNVTVFGSQPTLLLYAGLVLAALAAVLYGAWAWDGRRPAPAAPWGHVGAGVLAVALVAWTGNSLAEQAVRLRGLGQRNTGLVAQIPSFPFGRFFETVAMRTAWKEPLVPTERFAADVRQRMHSAAPAARPADIVVFLQESQFNPLGLEDYPGVAGRLPAFEADAATVAHGPLRVHVFGGGTWLSEFAVATGVPHNAFGEGGDFAPFSVAPGIHRSLVRSLRDAGYHTVALYPVRGNMMNARAAYQAYGYDAFYDSDELGLSDGFQVRDRTMHAAARRVLERERAQGKPVLLFVVTIFNHSEHGVHLDRVPPGLLAAAQPKLADYLWRTQQFQAAVQETQAAVLGDARPAVVAWFGDHQPPFAGALAWRARTGDAERAPAHLQTWYDVRSNRGGAGRVAPGAAALDIAFLPGVLAEAAGAPLDELLAANITAREQCGGLLRECARPGIRDAYFSYVWRDLKAIELP